MDKKKRLRKKYFFYRKKKYFDIKPSFFNPLLRLIKKKNKKRFINLASYYPASYEVNILKLFKTEVINKLRIFLPVLTGVGKMDFYEWKKNEILEINKFGMLEPVLLSRKIVPDIMLVPLLAYDNQNYRLGYGGGFYDRYLNKHSNAYKKILTVGIAFSFQKHHKLPVNKKDVRLDYILTEKGIL